MQNYKYMCNLLQIILPLLSIPAPPPRLTAPPPRAAPPRRGTGRPRRAPPPAPPQRARRPEPRRCGGPAQSRRAWPGRRRAGEAARGPAPPRAAPPSAAAAPAGAQILESVKRFGASRGGGVDGAAEVSGQFRERCLVREVWQQQGIVKRVRARGQGRALAPRQGADSRPDPRLRLAPPPPHPTPVHQALAGAGSLGWPFQRVTLPELPTTTWWCIGVPTGAQQERGQGFWLTWSESEAALLSRHCVSRWMRSSSRAFSLCNVTQQRTPT
jgi:hypothetical protein